MKDTTLELIIKQIRLERNTQALPSIQTEGNSKAKHPMPADIFIDGEFTIATFRSKRTFYNKEMKELLSTKNTRTFYNVYGNILAYRNEERTWDIIDSEGKTILKKTKEPLIAKDCICIEVGTKKTMFTREGETICALECEEAQLHNERIIIQRNTKDGFIYSVYNGDKRKEELPLVIEEDWRGLPSIAIENCVWGETHCGTLERDRGGFRLFDRDGKEVGGTYFRKNETIKKFEEKEDGFSIQTREGRYTDYREYTYHYDRRLRQKGRPKLGKYTKATTDREPDPDGLRRTPDKFKEKTIIMGIRKMGGDVEAIKMFEEDDLSGEGTFFVVKTHTQNGKSYIGCFNVIDTQEAVEATAAWVAEENSRKEEEGAKPDLQRVVNQVQLSLIFEWERLFPTEDVLELAQLKIKSGSSHQELLSECLDSAHLLLDIKNFGEIDPSN